MVMTERLKELVVNLASEADIAAAAIEEGMLTLRQAGMEKVRSGLTSVQEVSRVTS
jgi:type IV pilus assembly protein PilB